MSLLTDKRKLIAQTNTLAIASVVEITNLLQDRSVPELAYQLRLTLPPVAEQFSSVAATVSTQYYADARVQARVASEYVARPFVPDVDPVVQSSIGYAISRLTVDNNYGTFQSILAGSIQRVVSDGDRLTVEDNIDRDPDGQLFERVASGNACAFCLTMAAVSELQRSSEASDYHNFCQCTVRAVFTGQKPFDRNEYKVAREAYSLAGSELQTRRDEVGYLDLPRSQRLKQYPELALNTKNHLRLVREITGWK